MKKLVIMLAIVLTLALAGTGFAKMKGEKVFDTKNGKVVFSAEKHKAAGLKCDDCHKNPKVFDMKPGAAKLPVPHKADESCGVCHKDGGKAFSQTDTSSCNKCHHK